MTVTETEPLVVVIVVDVACFEKGRSKRKRRYACCGTLRLEEVYGMVAELFAKQECVAVERFFGHVFSCCNLYMLDQ